MPRTYNMEQRADVTAQTRQRIVDAVRAEILDVGSTQLTLATVAARADVSLRTLYNHAPSREALLEMALRDLVEAAGAATHSAARIHPDAEPAEALGRFIASLFSVYERLRPMFVTVLCEAGNPRLAATIAESRLVGHGRIGEILAPAAEAGLLRTSLERAQAFASATILFTTWQHLAEDLGLSTAEAAALVTEYLCGTLLHQAVADGAP